MSQGGDVRGVGGESLQTAEGRSPLGIAGKEREMGMLVF